jgi:DnaJ-class molecular chaperone
MGNMSALGISLIVAGLALVCGALILRPRASRTDEEEKTESRKEEKMETGGAASSGKVCKDCNGTGLGLVKQPAKPGRRLYPGRCKACDGRGRIAAPVESEPVPIAEPEKNKRKRRDPFSFG